MSRFVSVIVPAFNEEESIGRLLDALLCQSYEKKHFEVLVVDNGSVDQTRAIVLKYGPPVRLLTELSSQNPDAARNRALTIAKGKVLAFIDADCIPNPDWLENGVRAISDRCEPSLAAGKIEFSFKESKPTVSELYDSVSFLQHDVSTKRRGVAFTANLFVSRKVFDKTGPFPVVPGWNGDSWFTQKATKLGHELVYTPEAIIQHPARSLFPLLKKIWRIGYGQASSQDEKRLGKPHVSFFSLLKSKPHFSNLIPWNLQKRMRAYKGDISHFRLLQTWCFGYVVLFIGGLAALYGYVTHVTLLNRRRNKIDQRAPQKLATNASH